MGQPLAIAGTAPVTAWLLGAYGWRQMIIIEGILPFIWLPIWWFGIRDHPREDKWLPTEERAYLETTLQREVTGLAPSRSQSVWASLGQPLVEVRSGVKQGDVVAVSGSFLLKSELLKGSLSGGE